MKLNDKNSEIKEKETKEEKEYRSTIKEIPTEFGLIDLEILLQNLTTLLSKKQERPMDNFCL